MGAWWRAILGKVLRHWWGRFHGTFTSLPSFPFIKHANKCYTNVSVVMQQDTEILLPLVAVVVCRQTVLYQFLIPRAACSHLLARG